VSRGERARAHGDALPTSPRRSHSLPSLFVAPQLFACEFQKASKECNAVGGIVLVVTGDCTLMTAVLRNCSTLRSLVGNPIELPDLNATEVRLSPPPPFPQPTMQNPHATHTHQHKCAHLDKSTR
jgi:hypothetical protein